MALQLDQQQINHPYSVHHYVAGPVYSGQTFQAGLSGLMPTIKLWMGKLGSPDNLIVEIQGVDEDGKPDSNILASEEILSENVSDYPGSELTIIFSSPPTVSSGTKYSIVLHQKDNGGTFPTDVYTPMGVQTGDPYANGQYVYSVSSGSYWDLSYFTCDYYFKTYVETETEELEDINNDIRTRFYYDLYDMVNDFRTKGTTTIINDINNDFRCKDYAQDNIMNDFRMTGAPVVRDDINNKFNMSKTQLEDINNDFRMGVFVLDDINNKFNYCIEETEVINNIFVSTKQSLEDFDNDFRSKLEVESNIMNDFRMIASWQKDEDYGFQSAGKTEVKVYVGGVEQTDVDIDSITVNQNLNSVSTASFILGRAYDNTKPNMDAEVEIRYKEITLYTGYIVEINPTDSPESIKIDCQDEYYKLNKTKKYFLVGRKPVDVNEYYYETIKEAISSLGISYNIGDFIPQTMDLYGSGISDAISNLVENCGNFAWFIKPDKTKVLWEAGRGNIVNINRQQLNTNLGLYQVIKHSFKDSIVGLVNKLKVQMGNWNIRSNSDDVSEGTGTVTYNYIYHTRHEVFGEPAWDADLETLAINGITGFGYDNQDPDLDYKDVFTKFYLPLLEPQMESWTDRYPPLVQVSWGNVIGWNNLKEYLSEGFSINYGFQANYEYPLGASDITKPYVSFSQPQVVYDIANGECYRVRAKQVKLYLWKEHKVTYTVNPQTDPDTAPEEDADNPLMFYTDKLGDYPDTILEILNLSNLSKQEGYILKDDDGKIIENIPSWDDTDFAEDYANWQLTKNCDKKITGSIDVTIDTMLYYQIDLSKRIQIDGVIDPINITSISYNFNNFIATINLENFRYYKRTVSLQSRGE